jgi:chemotaxis response regulator CheB
MTMLRSCSEPGCTSKTLGQFCLEHEPPHRLSVLVSAEDADVAAQACATVVKAWPTAKIVCEPTGRDPLELALERSPDVLVLARDEASPEALATALVIGHGLPSVRVVLVAAVTETAEDALVPVWATA